MAALWNAAFFHAIMRRMIGKAYKTLFIDWYKTLSHSRFWEHLEDSGHPHNHEGRVISDFLFKHNQDLINPWMRGEIATDDILRQISEKTGISHDLIRDELEYSCRNMRLASDEIVHLVQKARKAGIRCVIATDNMDTFRSYTIPHMHLNELFDDFLISCELGVLKFDTDKDRKSIPFFDSYLKAHNLSYRDVALLDDSVDDGFYHDMGFRIIQVSKPDDFSAHLSQFAR